MSEEDEKKSIIDLVRHGETTAGQCFLGSTDAQLSELGWQQMESAGLLLDYDVVISSPLLRCYEFASRYAEKIHKPLIVDAQLREIHFGQWEAKTAEQICKTDEKKLSAFWRDPVKHTPPDGESLLAFKERVLQAYYSIVDEWQGKKILLACHGGVIKMILCDLLAIETQKMNKIAIDYAGVSRVSMWEDISQISFINHVSLKQE